jgi:hypothetical protein
MFQKNIMVFLAIIIIFISHCNGNPIDPYELDKKIWDLDYRSTNILHVINILGLQYQLYQKQLTSELAQRYFHYYYVNPVSYVLGYQKSTNMNSNFYGYLNAIYYHSSFFDEIQESNNSECMKLAKKLLVKTPVFNVDPDATIPMIFHNNGNADLKVKIRGYSAEDESDLNYPLLFEKTISRGGTWVQYFYPENIVDKSFYITAEDTSSSGYTCNYIILEDFKPYADKLECDFTQAADGYRIDSLYYDYSYWDYSYWNGYGSRYVERMIPKCDRDPSFDYHYMVLDYLYYWDKFEDKFGSVF